MTFGIAPKLEQLEHHIRTLQIKVEQCELRDKQLVVMFKMILDKSTNPHRSKQRELKIVDIINFMEQLVQKNSTLVPEGINEPADLLSEMVKRGNH